MNTPWNGTTIAELRRLWADGLPTEEIGRRLHLSKDAVIAKAHRLGLAARPSPIRRDGIHRARPQRAGKTTLPPLGSLA